MVSSRPNHNLSLALLEDQSTNLRNTWKRWLIFFLASLVQLSAYFCLNTVIILEEYLEKALPPSVFESSWLESAYSWPNVVLALFGGLFTDYFGVRLSLITFITCMTTGQLIISLGAAKPCFDILIMGRVILGVGGDSLLVAQLTLLVKWFRGTQLTYVVGILICCTRLGNSLDALISPKLAENGHLSAPFYIGLGMCLFAWVTCLLLVKIDKAVDKQEEDEEQRNSLDGSDHSRRDSFTRENVFSLLNPLNLLLLLNCCTIYLAYHFLNNALHKNLMEEFHFSENQTGIIIFTVYMLSGVLSIPIGYELNKTGKRALSLIIASLALLGATLGFKFLQFEAKTPNHWVFVPLLGIVIFYAIYVVAFWPSIRLVADERVVGICYGSIFFAKNLLLTTLQLVFCDEDPESKKEKWHENFYIRCCLIVSIGIIVTIILYFKDSKEDAKLGRPVDHTGVEENHPIHIHI